MRKQPDWDTDPAERTVGSASLKVAAKLGACPGRCKRYLAANKVNQLHRRRRYVDDCFVRAANYVTSYTYSQNHGPPVLSHAL